MKKILVLLLIIFSFNSFSEVIRIANFNTKRLGESKKNYKVTADIVRKFDIIGLEEVMNEKGLKLLLKELNNDKNVKWDYLISENPVGTAKYKEYYAVVYKKDKVNSIKSLGNYNKGGFIRPSFGVKIQSNRFDFVLVLAHSIYGDDIKYRVEEASRYHKVYDYFRNLSKEEDIILMGDFNLPATNFAFKSLYEKGLIAVIDANKYKTTLSDKGLANAYDNIFINLISTIEFNNTYGVYNFGKNKNYTKIRNYISDHIIVFAEFENSLDLDD